MLRKIFATRTKVVLMEYLHVFRALLAKLIEEPEEKQTFDRLLEMAENLAAKH